MTSMTMGGGSERSNRAISNEIARLRKQNKAIADRLEMLEIQLAHQGGYIGVEASRAYFEKHGIALD